jgi:hypothetical protein
VSCTRRRSASDIPASSGIVVIGWADVDADGGELPAGVNVRVGVVVGVEVGSAVGAGVEVGVAIGVKVGSGVRVGVAVAVDIGAGSGVGVGVGTLSAGRLQLNVRTPTKGRKNARKHLPRFRSMMNKSILPIYATTEGTNDRYHRCLSTFAQLLISDSPVV